MADKAANGKKAKPADGVLGSLPATRPSRLGRHARSGAGGPVEAARAAGRGAKATSAASRKAKPKPRAAPAAPKAKATPVRPTAEAPATHRPRAVRDGSPALQAPAAKAEAQREEVVTRSSPSGPELVTTVVQAAGELASIGMTIGGQLLKRAAERLPKP